MKSLLYMCRRYKLATALNVLGLSIALAAFYLFMTQVGYNRTYNHGLAAHDRTYRVEMRSAQMGDEWNCFVMRPLERAVADLPHVEAVQSMSLGFSMGSNASTIKVGERELTTTMTTMGRPGLSFFGVRMRYGSEREWQHTPASVIVTRSEAVRLFGRENAVGQRFTCKESKHTYTVVGVADDLPENCLLPGGLYTCYGDESMDSFTEWSYIVYLRLDRPESRAAVERGMKQKLMSLYGVKDEREIDREADIKLRLTSLDDTYFSGIGLADKGNRNLVGVLMGASVFVLLVALLNMVNFTLAQAPVRMRGINTRRVMGASVGALRLGMVLENVLVSLVALALAALWVELFASNSACMRLMSGSIGLAAHLPLALLTLGAALAVGVVSALFPAWYATSFAPALVLKGAFSLSPRGRWLRAAMLFVQFVIAFGLVAYVGVMATQSHYIFNADYGFNKDEVVFAPLSREAMDKKAAIAQELRRLPFVESTAYGATELGDGDLYMRWGRGGGDKAMNFYVIMVDHDYLHTMGIPVVEGRDFTEADAKGAYIVNRAMMRQYRWLHLDEPIYGADKPNEMANYPIVGVCDDFRLTSMRKDNSDMAVAFLIAGADMAEWGDRCGKLFVRVAAGYDKVAARRELARVMQRVDPTEAYDFAFLDQRLEQTYADEFRFIAQVRAFALVCIAITLIGVFCLTMFETEHRRKEIALRKVMGSTVGEVLVLLARRYVWPLVGAFVLSVPVAWWLASQWLQSFADHAPIRWWVFALAFAVTSTVVLLTVVVQSWRVARTNPVESIKTE